MLNQHHVHKEIEGNDGEKGNYLITDSGEQSSLLSGLPPNNKNTDKAWYGKSEKDRQKHDIAGNIYLLNH